MPPTALYDACVLYPAALRSLLVQLAAMGLVEARWSARIHQEWIRGLLRHRTDLTQDALQRVAGLMDAAVPGCLVTGYEELIPALRLPDPDDRHVLAAAITGRAEVIVTVNLKDFPVAALAPFGIKAQHPDLFIRHILDQHPDAVAGVRACRQRLRNPPRTVDDYLATLARQGLPGTVEFLRGRADEL